MHKKQYARPGIRTFSSPCVLEMMGPGCAQSGQVNVDMYRGSAMLERPYEYRLAMKTDLEVENLNSIDKVQEVAHV